MKLFKGLVNWYNEDTDKMEIDCIYGFAETMSNFVQRIEHSMPDNSIENLDVSVLNLMANEDQLLWVNVDDVHTQLAIAEENDY